MSLGYLFAAGGAIAFAKAQLEPPRFAFYGSVSWRSPSSSRFPRSSRAASLVDAVVLAGDAAGVVVGKVGARRADAALPQVLALARLDLWRFPQAPLSLTSSPVFS